jgi:hypothetical protein
MDAIRRWAHYGQRGEPQTQTKRVTKADWRQGRDVPFLKPVTAKWDVPLPAGSLQKILGGFQPQAMEDKWFIYTEGPDAAGVATLHLIRSWTGNPTAAITMHIPGTPDAPQEEGARFTAIMWESDEERIRGATEEGSKEMAVTVCEWVLGVQLPESAAKDS